MPEMDGFEAFTLMYDAGRDQSDLHLALNAIGKFRYTHAQIDASKLRLDGSSPKSLQLPLLKVLELIELNTDLTKETPEGPAALLELSIDPRLN